MNNRYIAKHEFGGDWQVWDQNRNMPVATGLTEDEAEQNANDRNAAESKEKEKFV